MANQPGNGRTPRDDRSEYVRGRNEHWNDPAHQVRDENQTMREDTERTRDEARRLRERTEEYGGGQSGYGAGRFGDDRSMGPNYRNQTRSGRDIDADRGGVRTDDRFTGRGGEGYDEDRPGYNSGYNRGGMGYGGAGADDGMPRQTRSQQGFRGGSTVQEDRAGKPGQSSDEYGPNYGGNYEDQRHGARSQGSHRGKGPRGYTRSDDRIREAVCEALADDHNIDATHIEVVVKNGEILLTGHVDDRQQKRMAEDVALNQSGVQDVQNQLRVGTPGNPESANAVGKSETETSPTDNKPRA